MSFMIAGLHVVFDRNLTEPVEDWSRVRAPSRARRRRARHKQRITIVQVPKQEAYLIAGRLFVHPDTWPTIEARIRAETEQQHRTPRFPWGA